MRRYLLPGLLCVAALLGLAFSWNTESAWMIALAAYGLAAAWWVVTAARSPPPLRRHLAAVFAPALLPVVLIGLSVLALAETDAAAIAVMGMAPFVAALLLPSAVGAFAIALRMAK